MDFTGHENDIIYDAVRYYQMNKAVTGTKLYLDCDTILIKLFPKVKINGIEPGLRTDT
jgi:hypothetical protein